MIVLGIDFETTGKDPKVDRVIEVGFAKWDTERKVPVEVGSFLLNHGPVENIVVSAEITEITGIIASDLENYGVPPVVAFAALLEAFKGAEFAVAHNGAVFDKILFETELLRLGIENTVKRVPWIDTMTDVPYPKAIGTRKLTYLAAEHEFLNPFQHRALFDVLTMLRVMSHYDMNEIIELQQSPMVTLQALVSFDDKELAKARGYRWKSDTRQWLKSMKEKQVAAEVAEADFKIVKVEE